MLNVKEAERFWDKVLISDECWEWQAYTMPCGYGQIQLRRLRGVFLAHRAAYLHIVGPIPDGFVIDHLCRNRKCVRPTHLEVVTSKENTLRGVGASAQNARKTHCPKGHSLAGANLVASEVGRKCRTCVNERVRLRYRARRLAARMARK